MGNPIREHRLAGIKCPIPPHLLCFSLRQLAVNGSDLLHIGISSGKNIGDTLDTLLNKVIEGELPNEKEALLIYAKNSIDNDA